MDEVDLELAERLLRAYESFKQGDVDCSREICEQILVANPDSAATLHLSGIIDCHFKSFEEAALKIFNS